MSIDELPIEELSDDELSDDEVYESEFTVVRLTEDEHRAMEALTAVALANARAIGLTAALNHKVDIPDCTDANIPTVFGQKWRLSFRQTRKGLREEYGDNLRDLFHLAVRENVYACHKGAAVCLAFGPDVPKDSKLARLYAPDTYAELEGRALVFDGAADSTKPSELFRTTSFSERPCAWDLLRAMSIIWFFEAASLYSSNSRKAFDLLCEASSAREFAKARQWESSTEVFMHDDIRQRKSAQAKAMNKVRHSSRDKAEDMVLQEWQKKPRQFDSGAKAGLHFSNWLASQGIDYSPRTVTEWILARAKVIGIQFR